jgi:hypothetical protein
LAHHAEVSLLPTARKQWHPRHPSARDALNACATHCAPDYTELHATPQTMHEVQ